MPNFFYIGKSLRNLYLEGNPLKTISKNLLYEVPSLDQLFVKNTQLTELSCLHLTFLSNVEAHENALTELPCLSFNTNKIVLKGNLITDIGINHAALLNRLGSLIFHNTPTLQGIHDYMNLEKHPTCKLDVRGSNNLNLCKCEHVWMKIAHEMGASILVTDMECGNDGAMWTELNSAALLEQCDQSSLIGEHCYQLFVEKN